jgi:SAM-dependent methyltransferase
VTPFDTLWAGDLLDQVGFGAGDRVLDLAAAGGRGGGLTLPFGDASFDVVVCHHGLQLLPDRGRALAEVRRVLAPRGWAAVAVWGPIGRNPAFAALAESLERRAGVRRGHRRPARAGPPQGPGVQLALRGRPRRRGGPRGSPTWSRTKTPYDLRHAAVSTWLNGGVPPTTAAVLCWCWLVAPTGFEPALPP